MGLDLKGKQAEAFCDALLSAFPRWRDLDAMVYFELGVQLESIVERGPLNTVALDLVRWAQARSRVDDLLRAALAQNGTNEDLRRFAYEVALTSSAAPAGKLESLVVDGTPYLDAATWRAKMERSERCVARIEYRKGGAWDGMGTGFLVAPDLLMTNQHVLRDLRRVGPPWRACFDYAVDERGELQGGRPCDFAGAEPVCGSPIEQLDYVVLRLAERVSRDAHADGSRRGVLDPMARDLVVREPLFILQHPNAERLKLGVGVISDIRSAPPRVDYTANTLRGSSGSPCFTLDWQLVALHHAGGVGANEGIPLAPVLADLMGKITLGDTGP